MSAGQVLSLKIYSGVSISTTTATSTGQTNSYFSKSQISVPCFWDILQCSVIFIGYSALKIRGKRGVEVVAY
jgi:hypothetical protein